MFVTPSAARIPNTSSDESCCVPTFINAFGAEPARLRAAVCAALVTASALAVPAAAIPRPARRTKSRRLMSISLLRSRLQRFRAHERLPRWHHRAEFFDLFWPHGDERWADRAAGKAKHCHQLFHDGNLVSL